MNTNIKHSVQLSQAKLGLLAYWSMICAPVFNSNDCGAEIKIGVRKGLDS